MDANQNKAPDIIVAGLCKTYGKQVVLDHFDIAFTGGQVTCIMGDSGLGKTTLLHILMGLVPADKGIIQGVKNHRISAVFQEDRLLESFGAVTNVRFAASKGFDRDAIIRDLRELGLGDSLQKPVSQLSGGMRRRVSIARAVAAEGEVIFLDEPFEGLDAQTKAQTAAYLKDRIRGKTVLMVTHNREEVDLMEAQLYFMSRHIALPIA